MAQLEPKVFKLRNGHAVTIRPITPSDASAHLDFRKRVPQDTTFTMQYVGMPLPSVEETRARLEIQLKDPKIFFVGAFDGDRVIGLVNLRLPYPDHPWEQHLGQFAMMILKEYWGQGLGQEFLRIQEEFAISIGLTRIEAMVRTANERGVKLYRRAGFRIEGVRANAAYIDGKFEDEYFIAKLLDEPIRDWQPPTLVTSRLMMRPVTLDDAESIFEYAKNPNVSLYTLWEPHKSVQDSLDYIKDYVFDYYSRGIPEPWGIALKENPDVLIGTVGCFWTSKSGKAMEIAYAMGEKYWGKGLMAEAADAVVDFAFEEYGLKRMQARCKAENTASARVMQKIGMEYEGTLKSGIFHRDRFWDMIYYATVR